MAQVRLTINERVYRMGCDEGQEPMLIELARDIDRRIEGYKADFGEVGDMRLLIMAALELGDELAELRRRLESVEADAGELRRGQSAADQQVAAAEAALAETLDAAAARVERLSAALADDSAE